MTRIFTVTPLEELALLYWIGKAMRIIFPQDLFLLLSDFAVVEQTVDHLIVLICFRDFRFLIERLLLHPQLFL